EVSSQRDLYSDRIEQVWRNAKALHAFRRLDTAEVCAPPCIDRQVLKRIALRPPVQIIGHRGFISLNTLTGNLLPERNDPVEIIKRKRLEQNRVDDAEYRAVGADAQRQCQRRNYRVARFFQKHPPTVTQVLKQCFHRRFLLDTASSNPVPDLTECQRVEGSEF